MSLLSLNALARGFSALSQRVSSFCSGINTVRVSIFALAAAFGLAATFLPASAEAQTLCRIGRRR